MRVPKNLEMGLIESTLYVFNRKIILTLFTAPAQYQNTKPVPLVIGGVEIKPGESRQLEIPIVNLYTGNDISMPVQVIHAKKPGPRVFICAAIHGDELNGIEIIRRLIDSKKLKLIAGSLVLVPMVNVYGVLGLTRYMPDRRDLNRCFPGSDKGSLAARVADCFLKEIVEGSDYGIDLHTGAIHRSNLPQIRADLDDEETRVLAEQFGVPVLINSTLRDGSLRQAAVEMGTKILLYEAGEALRFDELSIRAGMTGILNVLSLLGLIRARKKVEKSKINPFIAYSSVWVRAGASGIVRTRCTIGDHVEKGDVLAEVGTALGGDTTEVRSSRKGIVIGYQNIPLVQEGDAMFHIAFFGGAGEEVAEQVGLMTEMHLPDDDKPELPSV